jgi:hypothetical protein
MITSSRFMPALLELGHPPGEFGDPFYVPGGDVLMPARIQQPAFDPWYPRGGMP